jgi:hypothetical protein
MPIIPKNVLDWTGGVAQVTEHLTSKPEALSSNSSTIKKQNKKILDKDMYL